VYLGFAWLSEQQTTKLTDLYLGLFAKLRKTTVCLVLSVRPSVFLFAWNYLAPTGGIFIDFDIFEDCLKALR